MPKRSTTPCRISSMWDRADLLSNMLATDAYRGRIASAEQLMPELEASARRAGHHGALYSHAFYVDAIEATRTGDLRASLERSMRTLEGAHFRYVTRTAVGRSPLYLGDVDHALNQLAMVVEKGANLSQPRSRRSPTSTARDLRWPPAGGR